MWTMLATRRGTARCAQAIVQLGKSLNLETVAEGVEQAEQVEGLRAIGCQYGQGFFFAYPVSSDDMDKALPLIASGELAEAVMAHLERDAE